MVDIGLDIEEQRVTLVMNRTFDVGDQLVARAKFRNTDGEHYDPDDVTFMVRSPNDAGESSFVFGVDARVTKISTGIYRFVSEILEADGDYALRVKIDDSDNPSSALERTFRVTPTAFDDP